MIVEYKGMLLRLTCGRCCGKLQKTASQIYCKKCNTGCIMEPVGQRIFQFTEYSTYSELEKSNRAIKNMPTVI